MEGGVELIYGSAAPQCPPFQPFPRSHVQSNKVQYKIASFPAACTATQFGPAPHCFVDSTQIAEESHDRDEFYRKLFFINSFLDTLSSPLHYLWDSQPDKATIFTQHDVIRFSCLELSMQVQSCDDLCVLRLSWCANGGRCCRPMEVLALTRDWWPVMAAEQAGHFSLREWGRFRGNANLGKFHTLSSSSRNIQQHLHNNSVRREGASESHSNAFSSAKLDLNSGSTLQVSVQ